MKCKNCGDDLISVNGRFFHTVMVNVGTPEKVVFVPAYLQTNKSGTCIYPEVVE